VVIGVISVVTGILLPVLGAARRQARVVVNMNNQRQVVSGANCFASDNEESYPESVATIGVADIHWNWQEPMMLTGTRALSPRRHRSMSAYLGSYIKDAGTMYCPNAPKKYKYFQRAWDAGDDWDNPETAPKQDPVVGTYCFYWNYTGCLEEGRVFRGPAGPSCGGGRSRLVVSDYFGYDHWRSRNWTGRRRGEVELRAGYTDGHVEAFTPSEAAPMRVSITADGSRAYEAGVGPGIIYLPEDAVD
jgi:hypothetical protein